MMWRAVTSCTPEGGELEAACYVAETALDEVDLLSGVEG
jgi:hypothetical protein